MLTGQEMGTLVDEAIKWPFGVAAALVAAWIGYRAWVAQQNRGKRYRAESLRESGYREMWEALQRAEVLTRQVAQTGELANVEELVRDVNATIMKNEFALADDDRRLAGEYMGAAKRMAELLHTQGSIDERGTFARTGADTYGGAFALAYQDLVISRENVLSRVRAALGFQG